MSLNGGGTNGNANRLDERFAALKAAGRAGLDYPGIGPEHAWLHDVGRVNYVHAADKEALEAFQLLSRIEGIIPAFEPAHALAEVAKIAPKLPKDHLIVANLCGRGDKDIFSAAKHLGTKL